MKNTTQRKWSFFTAIAVVAVIFVAALTCAVGMLAYTNSDNTQMSNGALSADVVNASSSSFPIVDLAAGDGVAAEYTYGQTYTVNGHDYTLGADAIDYKTALGLNSGDNVMRSGDDYDIKLKRFTYFDGTDGTAQTNGLRSAGTYVFTVNPAPVSGVSEYTVRVNRAGLDFSTVDWIPVFVNANAPKYKAHGDITSIYKHNDGWYPSQKADEVPVEIRTITNAYYYETGKEIPIKIANEVLDNNDVKTKTSTLRYNDDLTFEITDRAGTVFIDPNEYIATFTFHIPQDQLNNYYFDYGNKTEDDDIEDSNKGLSITQRTENSFVLSKHWFIAKYASLFVATDDTANYPYVPFHDSAKVAANNGKTTDDDGNNEGDRGELNTAIDTIKYTAALTVKTPVARFNSGCYEVRDDGKLNDDGTNYKLNSSGNPIEIIKEGTIKFDINYVDLNGQKYKIASQVTLDATKTEGQNTLSYYINKTMPAGHYTVKLYGEIAQSEMNLNLPAGYEPRPNKIQGEYWLTVLPAEIDSTLVNGIQQAIRGDRDESVQSGATDIEQYFNSYALGDNMLHKDLAAQLTTLNSSLNGTLLSDSMKTKSYWSDLTVNQQQQYFDSSVTLMYNRNTWSSSNYVTEQEMIGMLTTYGSYTIYYSVSAKNYVTVGGTDDVNRTDYGFRTMLSMGIQVSDIYNSVTSQSDPYFKDVTFNGGDAKTSVPQSTYYDDDFNDVEYVNVGRHYVTLTLRNEYTTWDTALPDGVDLDDYFELCGVNNRSLKVYYDVVPANNSWNVMPQMPSWSFNGFDKNVNSVTAGLKFDSTVKYALIPNTVTDLDSIEWGVAQNGIVFFTVDENGVVDNATAALLNSLKPASYYLKFYVDEVTVTVSKDGTEETVTNVNAYNDVARNSAGSPLANVTVSKATNSWTSTPNVVRWTYGEYKSAVHVITAEATYPALLPKDANGNAIEGFVYTNTGTAAPKFTVYDGDTVVTDLSKLHAGTYTLATSMDGSDYYLPIAETRMTFTVGKAINTWTTAPKLISWTYGGFEERYFTAGVPTFAESIDGQGNPAKVQYSITSIDDDDFEAVDFTVFSKDIFSSLNAGSYTLTVSYAGTDDYSRLDSEVLFTVGRYTNSWNPSPSLRGWTYRSFTAGLFTAGVPTKRDDANAVVTYVVNGGQLESGLTLTVNADGTLTTDSIQTLTALAAGSYKLNATYPKTDNYDAINASIDFEVAKIANSWATTPSVIGWIYGSFDNSYFTAGVPTYYESKDNNGNPLSVEYTLTKTDDNSFESVMFTSLSEVDFNQLNAGAYRIEVYYAPSDNYGELPAVVTFTVGKCVNTWSVNPGLRSWDYKTFNSSLFTAGVPTLQADASATVSYVLYKVTLNGETRVETEIGALTVTDGKLTDDSLTQLTDLGKGSYALKVTYPATVNYDALTPVIDFDVFKTANSWATKPRVIGWTYGSFSDEYFTAGVPTFTESMENGVAATVKYNLTKDGDDSFAVTFTSLADADFASLGAGSYALYASYAGTDNYDELKAEDTVVTFRVSQVTSNNWKDGVSPDISGWTYGAFADNLLTNGEPEYGEVSYKLVGALSNGAAFAAETFTSDNDKSAFDKVKERLTSLNAGAYTLEATSGSTADYSAIEWSKSFAVARADNDWATKPSIGNWTFGGNASTPNNGVVKYESDKATVVCKYYKAGENGNLDGEAMLGEDGKPIAAGNYAYVITVNDTINYNGFTTTLLFTINKAANTWKTQPASTVTWTYNSAENTPIEFEANYNNDALVITVDGDEVTAANLNETLKGKGVGSHSIVAYVPAKGNYSAIEAVTVTLVVVRASDSFGNFNVPASWDWDDVEQKTGSWQTDWNTELKVPVPTVSTTATAIVYKGSAEELAVTLHYETVNGKKDVLETDLNALKTKLLGLHVGAYAIKFVVADSANYTGCTVSAEFAVLKVNNIWDGSDGAPKIGGWQYNSSVANPTAKPMYGKGTVVFSYAQAGDETEAQLIADDSILTWKESTETAGGTYWLRAYVPGTGDYNSLVGYYKFNINAGKNDWVNNLGVIAWNWNGYNKTVNLFSGSARNNGVATFKIYVGNKDSNRNLATTDFVANGVTLDKTNAEIAALFCTNGFTLVSENNVMVVSDEVAKYLNALKPGTYLLSGSIAADNNYGELTSSVTFAVGKAANSWATGKAPAVSSYTYGNYSNTATFTFGETVYGDKSAVKYSLAGTTFLGENKDYGADVAGDYTQVQAWLTSLPAGNYTLYAWVAQAANGTYSALYDSNSPYNTRSFTVSRATNGWTNGTIVTQVSKLYSEITADSFNKTEFAKLYAQLVPIDGDVNYALINDDYSSRNTNELDYDGLFAAIKALPSGEYVIRATVAETNNYTAIGAKDTRLTISKHGNAFIGLPDSLTAQWARKANESNDGYVNNSVLTAFEVKADHGASTATYTLNKTTYATYSEFEQAVSALDAGSYNVTIAIDGTDEYASISAVRMLTVSPATNSWLNGWNIDGSLTATDSATKANNTWAWKSAVSWTKAVPMYGTTVYVEIRLSGASSALQYVTIDYSVSNGDSAVETISEAISKLDKGNYELIVSAPASVNWNGLSNKTTFEITKVTNSWTTAPQVKDSPNNKWEYGNTPTILAEAKYGTVRYEYATKSGAKLTSMPTTAGEYVIKCIVDDSTNYGGISGQINVTIEKTTNRNFSVTLGVDGWTWGSYDRETNVFRGTPEITELENATVKFSVGTGTGESFVALPNLGEFSLNALGLVEKGSDAETALRALTGGTTKENNRTTYTLRIHVGGTTNYNGFVQDNTFSVTGATNTWIKSPTVVPWVVNNWTDESLPDAVALYGEPAIVIASEANGTVYYKGAYVKTEDGLELVTEINRLNLAPEGYYVMTTFVEAETGHYNSPLTETYRFRINVKGAGEANNWDIWPSITDWQANLEGQYNLPVGKPLRGLPKFVFYVRNADGTRGQKVDETYTDIVVEKGDKYEEDIYIPMKYGDYILVASTQGSPTADGKSDALKDYELRLTISPRPLSFEQELRIDTLLYLGDRANWAQPTSLATLADAEYDYVYTNKRTGETSREMPKSADDYTVTVTISATYAESKSMSVDFTVKLTPNSWEAAPNIKDWSEEFGPNLPTGAATVGSDEIVYTYKNVVTGEDLGTDKPTTEGSYIMYADLIVPGYEPLHAEYEFTIEPAFDTDLLLIDIILGLVACAFTVVVTVLAVKRYRES